MAGARALSANRRLACAWCRLRPRRWRIGIGFCIGIVDARAHHRIEQIHLLEIDGEAGRALALPIAPRNACVRQRLVAAAVKASGEAGPMQFGEKTPIASTDGACGPAGVLAQAARTARLTARPRNTCMKSPLRRAKLAGAPIIATKPARSDAGARAAHSGMDQVQALDEFRRQRPLKGISSFVRPTPRILPEKRRDVDPARTERLCRALTEKARAALGEIDVVVSRRWARSFRL